MYNAVKLFFISKYAIIMSITRSAAAQLRLAIAIPHLSLGDIFQRVGNFRCCANAIYTFSQSKYSNSQAATLYIASGYCSIIAVELWFSI